MVIVPVIAIGIGFFALLFISFISSYIYLVRQAETIVIERLGKFHRVLLPGIYLLLPFFDEPRRYEWTFFDEVDDKKYRKYTRSSYRVDMRELVYDFPKQNVITRDNVTMQISAVLYYHIIDACAALYEVADLSGALEKLTQTTLRNVIGAMDLDETLISRDLINTKLRLILDEAAHKWGVQVTRVELQEVNPPLDIRQAMEKQMRAERDRRALILEAEGKKQSAILQAEGEQEAAILTAKGLARARMINAEGEANARLQNAQVEAQALELIRSSMPDMDPAAYLLALQYIKTLPQMTEGKDNKLVIVPYETSAMVGAVASLKTMFQEA